MKLSSSIFAAVIYVLLSYSANMAQGKLYFNTSLQTVGSSFSDGSSHNSFFFYNGITYQSSRFYFNLNIPLVVTPTNTFTQIDNTFLPNDQTNESSGSWFNHMRHMYEPSGTMMNTPSVGFGDMYINGSIEVIDESTILPSFSIDGYVKIPTATDKLGIGTGEFDFQIALGSRKYYQNVFVYAQLGYLFLGKVEGSGLTDPLTFSAGIGYTSKNRVHSFLLGYDSYSTIIQGTDSPKQLGLGYNYLINDGIFFTAIISAGLNSSTSDYTASIGLNFEI